MKDFEGNIHICQSRVEIKIEIIGFTLRSLRIPQRSLRLDISLTAKIAKGYAKVAKIPNTQLLIRIIYIKIHKEKIKHYEK
jgi:hypothetical protein